jgi:hypothetical protein
MNKKTCAVALSLIASSAYGTPMSGPVSEHAVRDSVQHALNRIEIRASDWDEGRSSSNLQLKKEKIDPLATAARIIRVGRTGIEENIRVSAAWVEAARIMRISRTGIELEIEVKDIENNPDDLPSVQHRDFRGRGTLPALPAPRRSCVAAEPTEDSISDWDGRSTDVKHHPASVRADGPGLIFDGWGQLLLSLHEFARAH